MDNAIVKDVILDKKMEWHEFNCKNFATSGELTVTITLSEYRDLVEKCATATQRIKEAEEGKYTRDNENRELKETVQALEHELCTFRKKVDILETATKTAEVPSAEKFTDPF